MHFYEFLLNGRIVPSNFEKCLIAGSFLQIISISMNNTNNIKIITYINKNNNELLILGHLEVFLLTGQHICSNNFAIICYRK